jgi:CheY-like chemotaxis protein
MSAPVGTPEVNPDNPFALIVTDLYMPDMNG